MKCVTMAHIVCQYDTPYLVKCVTTTNLMRVALTHICVPISGQADTPKCVSRHTSSFQCGVQSVHYTQVLYMIIEYGSWPWIMISIDNSKRILQQNIYRNRFWLRRHELAWPSFRYQKLVLGLSSSSHMQCALYLTGEMTTNYWTYHAWYIKSVILEI